MDPLSDVLRAVRLTGAFFFHVAASPPWAAWAAEARELVPRVLPDAEHLISYHVVMSGTCWGGAQGEPQVLLEPGDVIVFPHGDPHVMSSADRGPAPVDTLPSVPARYAETLVIGDGRGPRTVLVCGFLGCDVRPYNPLLSALPRCLHLRGLASGWLSGLPQQVVAESRQGHAGSETMLTRLAELMFLEAVRRHAAELPPGQTGWLAGLRDPVVAPALALLHGRPAHPWTLAELARQSATSRTVLAERFAQIVNVPPMQYLTQWRLQLAAEQLAAGSMKVATVAERVGYASEASFSRAFKRATGHAPATWRRARRPD